MTPAQQLDSFLAKYDAAVAAVAKKALAKLRKRFPGALELAYDNYNALAIGFSATERTSDAFVSVAVYPKWVSVFFLQGAKLKDPQKILKGAGNVVRHYRLESAEDLDKPELIEMLEQAKEKAPAPIEAGAKRKLIIKSVSEKQRPRR